MNFLLHKASSPEHAVALAQQYGEACRYIAGGTDIIIQLRRGSRAAEHLVDLSGLSSLRRIDRRGGSYWIGALVRHKDIETDAHLLADYPALCAAARVVGGHQVRNVATVGGNIANASPAADVATALVALDARIHALSSRGRRVLDIGEFFLAPGRTALAQGELIEGIELPRPAADHRNVFIKVGRRKAMEIAVASVAVGLRVGDRGATHVRIALGAVGPRPLRARTAEQLAEGAPLDPDRIAAAAKAAVTDCATRSDVRASAAYRNQAVQAIVARALQQCAAGAERSV